MSLFDVPSSRVSEAASWSHVLVVVVLVVVVVEDLPALTEKASSHNMSGVMV